MAVIGWILTLCQPAKGFTWWVIRLCFVVWGAMRDPAGAWMSLRHSVRIKIHRCLYLFYQRIRYTVRNPASLQRRLQRWVLGKVVWRIVDTMSCFLRSSTRKCQTSLVQQVRVKRSIAVCTSAKEANVRSLITQLTDELEPETVVKYVKLPYNDIDYFLINEREHDMVILCHSLHNRRLALTDGMDSLYDTFLPTVSGIFGKENVAVIAHDFSLQRIDNEVKYQTQMEVLRASQPTTFEKAALVLVAGKIGSRVEMLPNGWGELKQFIEKRQKRSIAVCTSAQEANVRSLITKLSDEIDNGAIVRYVELPYNDIDDFFIDEREHDMVILCHSIHNRRLAVTDVMDALYDKFLPTVARIFGKGNVGVIAHDFPLEKIDNEENYQTQMEAFEARQPTTFENASLVLVAGKIDNCIEIPPNSWSKIRRFIARGERETEIEDQI